MDFTLDKYSALLDALKAYPFESLTTCKGDVDKAYEDFCKNLEAPRRIVPVRSISMHGSPHSKESHGHRPSSTLESFRPGLVQGTTSSERKEYSKEASGKIKQYLIFLKLFLFLANNYRNI